MPRQVVKVKTKESVVSARVAPAVRKKLDKLARAAGVTRGEYAARVLAMHAGETFGTAVQDIHIVTALLRQDVAAAIRDFGQAKLLRAAADGAPELYQSAVRATTEDIADAIEGKEGQRPSC